MWSKTSLSIWISNYHIIFLIYYLKKLSVWFYFRKSSEGLKSINPGEKAPSMRLLAYGKLELHSILKVKDQTWHKSHFYLLNLCRFQVVFYYRIGLLVYIVYFSSFSGPLCKGKWLQVTIICVSIKY